MHFPRLLLVLCSAITSITAHPSAKAVALRAPAPAPLDDFLAEFQAATRRNIPQPRHVTTPRDGGNIYNRAARNSSAPAPNATVDLCTEPHFQGDCHNSTFPVNTCISLNGYAGSVLSFQPLSGFECLLAQGRCNVAMPYISVGSDDADNTAGDDLSALPWIKQSNSYMCFAEIEALRRFVRMRLRVSAREGGLVKKWTWVNVGLVEDSERDNAKASLPEV